MEKKQIDKDIREVKKDFSDERGRKTDAPKKPKDRPVKK